MPKTVNFDTIGAREYIDYVKKEGYGDELNAIDNKALISVGMDDARANSLNCIFQLYVMANHNVALKDIYKFENGKMPEHDKKKYHQEFKKFVEEHPIYIKDDKGNMTYNTKNAKIWGEMFNKANGKINEYKLPAFNIADPIEAAKNKEEMTMLTRIGTDLVQVTEHIFGKLHNPTVNNAFVEGFGSIANLNKFQNNVVALQSLKNSSFYPILKEASLANDLNTMALRKYFVEKNKDKFAGKSIEEFSKSFPLHNMLNTISATPFTAFQTFSKRTEAEQDMIINYLKNNGELSEELKAEMDASIQAMESTYIEGMKHTEHIEEFGRATDRGDFDRVLEPLKMDGKNTPIKLMNKLQLKNAVEGFNGTFGSYFSGGSAVVFTESAGKDIYDLVTVNGKTAKEYSAERYTIDPLYEGKSEFNELSEAQKEEYMKIAVMRAAATGEDTVAMHDIALNEKGEIKVSTEPAYTVETLEQKTHRKRIDEARKTSDAICKWVKDVDYNLLGQGSNQFDEMLKAVTNLKKYTDTKLTPDKNGLIPFEVDEELLDKQYETLEKIKAYLDYKDDQFGKEKDRRNDPGRKKHEQPRVTAAINSFDALEANYMKNQTQVNQREVNLRNSLIKNLDRQEKIWQADEDEYQRCLAKSVDLIYNIDAKKWKGKEEGKALEHYKKFSEGLPAEYNNDIASKILIDEKHPGRSIIYNAKMEYGQSEKKYTAEELLKKVKENTPIENKVTWPEGKKPEAHKNDVTKYKTNLWSQATKLEKKATNLYNAEDKLIAATKEPKNKIPDGSIVK